MSLDADKVFKMLQVISERHAVSNVAISIDSLVLALNTDQQLLLPILIQLRNEQKVLLFRNENVANARNSGRIDDYNKISLC
jgi:hypothetical protein